MNVDALTASIKVQLAHQYLNDLLLWHTDDPARFSRMVDGRGAGIGSPESWLRNLANICANPVVVAHYPALPGDVATGLAGMGLAMPMVAE